MHILMYNICVHQSGGRVRQIARVVLCRQEFAQDFSFKTHLFLQNVLQNFGTGVGGTCGGISADKGVGDTSEVL